MELLFILSLVFLLFCFIFRKRLAERLTVHHRKEWNTLPEYPKVETSVYKILAFNPKDYSSTKELEDIMELRLEQCLAGLSKLGYSTTVEFYSTEFVLIYLVKYTC